MKKLVLLPLFLFTSFSSAVFFFANRIPNNNLTNQSYQFSPFQVGSTVLTLTGLGLYFGFHAFKYNKQLTRTRTIDHDALIQHLDALDDNDPSIRWNQIEKKQVIYGGLCFISLLAATGITAYSVMSRFYPNLLT